MQEPSTQATPFDQLSLGSELRRVAVMNGTFLVAVIIAAVRSVFSPRLWALMFFEMWAREWLDRDRQLSTDAGGHARTLHHLEFR